MNYIGSKYSLISFIQDTISQVTNYQNNSGLTFCDLFAGTGIVGATYRKNGWKVISNDIQYYSYILNKHYIENSPPIDISLIEELNGLEGIDGFIYNNYCQGSGSGRNYFTDYNGRKCDAIRVQLEKLYNTKQISESEYIFYLASLINSIDKYANTASVYSAFLKHIKKSAERKFILEPLQIVDGIKGMVYNKDANELCREIKGDVLYLDPPYNNRQYYSNYHILETIARYDNPELYGTTGLRKNDNLKSKFCSKRTVEETFEDLIKNANFKYIFLSYNNEGLMDLDTIKRIMSKYGEYGFYTQQYKRFKADKEENRNILTSSTLEYLHFLIKK